MVRYYGWYSNKQRGIRKKEGLQRPGDEPDVGKEDIEIIDVAD
ncbi:MAG: putative transposase, partial [Planctomycetota bacterium]|nr:putative transposase [Planctomycetota bacterium]